MDSIVIREAKKTDSTNIIDFRKKIYSETDFLLDTSETFSCTIEQQEEFLSNTETRKSGIFLIAEKDNKIVGSASVTWINKLRIRHCAEYGTAILKDYWYQGIATQLFKEIIQIAKECEIEKINLETSNANTNAINLYKKLGFTIEGNKTKSFKVDSDYYDVVLMGKQI